MSRIARLLPVVARYGDSIEYDLQLLGLDLVDVFRGGLSWRKLEVVLEHLPEGSAYWAARAGDAEAAEDFLATRPPGWEPPSKRTGPPLLGFGPAEQQLHALRGDMALLIAKLDALMGADSVRVDAPPPPKFALAAALERREAATLGSLVSEVDAAIARSEAEQKEG